MSEFAFSLNAMQGWCNLGLSLQLFQKKVQASIPKGIEGGFQVHCSSKKFERIARESTNICLHMLKESNKSRFDSYSVRNSVLIISHITFRVGRVHFFFRNPFLK